MLKSVARKKIVVGSYFVFDSMKGRVDSFGRDEFNKIKKMPSTKNTDASGQGSQWFSECPAIIQLRLARPNNVFVNFVFNVFTPLALTESLDNVFHSPINSSV